jgi:hypothetical protein
MNQVVNMEYFINDSHENVFLSDLDYEILFQGYSLQRSSHEVHKIDAEWEQSVCVLTFRILNYSKDFHQF